MTHEKILGIEVAHVPNTFGTPAHIRITGITNQGPFTIRSISGLRTNKVEKKMEEARVIFARLIGEEVRVSERRFPRSVKRIVVPSSLPEWARGDWTKVTTTA